VPAPDPALRGAVETSYDRVAEHYATHFADELAAKPLDRALLNCFAELVNGPVADIGCGPGNVARYLHDRGVPVVGIDLSEQMVAQARRLNPSLTFRRGTMLDLAIDEAAWGGIVAFYSIIHLEPEELPLAFRQSRRGPAARRPSAARLPRRRGDPSSR
jgi:2-polyprenyl-3-methyl-5-hydroxy-6-metoxy-1,4-benzoquinol methylase